MSTPPEQRCDAPGERAPDGPATPPATVATPFAQPQATYTSLGAADPAPLSSPPSTTPPHVQRDKPTFDYHHQPQQPQQQEQQQQQQEQQQSAKFWTIEFFQQFFDVDTCLVLSRITNALVPVRPPDFLMDRDWRHDAAQPPVYFQEMEPTPSRKPDLYGPFWISTTLWMTLAIVSNIMSRIAFGHSSSSSKEQWNYDFTMASVASIVIYLYCFGLGSVVWGLMKYNALPISLVDTLCLYGYSLFIFFPVTVLCTIPVSPLQWVFALVGGVWSAAFLLVNLWPLWRRTLDRMWLVGMMTTVSAFHIALTMSFKFYFLNYKF